MGGRERTRAWVVTEVVPRDGLRLRPAESRDLDAIHAIELASFTDAWPLSAFRELLNQAHVDFEVAESPSRGVDGYIIALRAADEAEIANLAVAKSSRRCGAGRGLLSWFLAGAPARGVRTVFLEVRESNVAARALYEAHGFAPVGRRRQYYRSPVEDALLLRREL